MCWKLAEQLPQKDRAGSASWDFKEKRRRVWGRRERGDSLHKTASSHQPAPLPAQALIGFAMWQAGEEALVLLLGQSRSVPCLCCLPGHRGADTDHLETGGWRLDFGSPGPQLASPSQPHSRVRGPSKSRTAEPVSARPLCFPNGKLSD